MKLRRMIISIILVLSVLASTVVMLRLDSKDDVIMREAQAATYDENGFVEYVPAADAAAAYGTKENPFTVLEIVPYAGYAEIGYLTGSKEPVDMERLCRIAMGTEVSGQLSASAAGQFIEYLAVKGYLTLLTQKEADASNAKDAELPKEERKFAAYQFKEKIADDTKCYVTNANSFLRESIGLKYVTDGNTVNYDEFDIETYEFMGWYVQGTDQAFDFGERIFTDVELYAKWRLIKSNGAVIEPVIVTPDSYESVPAPGYTEGIMIEFRPSVPTSLSTGAVVENLPAPIGNVMTDGTVGGVKLEEPAEPSLSGVSGAEDYILRGWYLDAEGTIPYRFGSAIPEGYIKNGVMTLYPAWTLKGNCKITFCAEVPEEYMIAGNEVIWPDILSNPENGNGKASRTMTVSSASTFDTEEIPQLTLLGNVDYKVKNYQLDIVTVTPQDLNKGGNVGGALNQSATPDNLALIEKANIIMISPQSHFFDSIMPLADVIELKDNNNNKNYHQFGEDARTAVEIWEACMNTTLFEFDTTPDEGDTGMYGFLKNDLCWEVILAIFNECVLAEPKAALIYDAESYHMALMNGAGATSESPKKLLFGEKTLINVESMTGRNYASLASSNNVYKLYLMMNQMNPNLFYTTFLKDHIYAKMHNNISTGCYNWSENTGEVSNEVVYWNTATFLLCLLLDEADSNIWIENGVIKLKGNPWEKWGVIHDVYILSDNLDDETGLPNVESGLVKGNCFTYESDVVNLTDYFAVNASIPYQRHVADVYDYYERDDDSITMSEIVHYLIQIAKGETEKLPSEGYDKDIRILELQPSESYLDSRVWLWNINTYIDGFQGTTSITQQSSAEFIGKIEDLNSTYDMLYIGSDITAYEPTRTVFSQELIDTYAEGSARWYAAGSTVVLAESRTVRYQKTVKKDVNAGETVNIQIPQMLYKLKRVQIAPGKYLVEVDQSQNIQVFELIEPNGERKYDDNVYRQLAGGWGANVQVKAGDTIVTKYDANMDTLVYEPVEAGNFTSPVKQEYLTSETVTEWLPAGTEVVLAEGATLRGMYNLPEGMVISPYSYVHTGAEVPELEGASQALLGILGGNADDNNTYYYSGNDITLAKKKDILEFASAGYPVVVASRLMVRDAEDKLKVNTDVVDTASNMYALLTELAAGENDPDSPYYGNFFYEGTTDASKNYRQYKENLLRSLIETKCELVINRMPALYSDGKSVQESYINGKQGEIDNKKLEIGFKIVDADNGYYQLKFYIDGNADGRYTEEERLSGKLTIYEIIAGRKQEVTQLKPNRNYVMEADLEAYVGVIPWKIEVVKSDNPVVRDSVIECSAILPKDEQKPTIRVLQIVPANSQYSDPTIYLPCKEEVEALEAQYATWSRKGDLSLQDFYAQTRAYFLEGADPGVTWGEAAHLYDVFENTPNETKIPYDSNANETGIYRNTALGFWVYMREVQDFNIVTDRISVEGFIARTATEKQSSPDDYLEWAQEYDMLVLGFADAYQDINDDDALDTIEAFIASGRQTLFTHDTTSFRNNTKTSDEGYWYWGYNINRTFRNVLGMDRYGATLMYPVDINGNLQNNGLSISQTISRKNDAPYKPGTSQDTSSDAKLLANVLNNGKSGNNLRYYVQGYSDVFLYRYLNKIISDSLPTTQASKINIGQLTEYPYRIGNDIPVAETHCQYYQLDLEAEDIVVWYTLESSSADDAYASSYHDARNNYYLYSRGNVIYSGVGHERELTLDELKLFINTFVASYRVPADPPTIDLQNSNATSADMEYYYIDFDSWDELKAVGTSIVLKGDKQYQRVQYVVNEAVPLKNQKLTVDYHFASDEANGIPLTEKTDEGLKESGYYVLEQPITDDGALLVPYSSETDLPVTELLVGKEYYIDIPLSLMTGKDSLQLIFRATIQYGRKNDQNVYAYQKISFLRRGLYDLD